MPNQLQADAVKGALNSLLAKQYILLAPSDVLTRATNILKAAYDKGNLLENVVAAVKALNDTSTKEVPAHTEFKRLPTTADAAVTLLVDDKVIQVAQQKLAGIVLNASPDNVDLTDMTSCYQELNKVSPTAFPNVTIHPAPPEPDPINIHTDPEDPVDKGGEVR